MLSLMTSHRSSGSDSISIHTNGIQGLVLHANDPRAISYGGSASLKIFAGERMRDIYSFAAYNNITVVGGADLNVGIGGWIAFGGHSPISAQYGLGADQVLEMDVVTADGIFRTVDENNHPDLFWALRGVRSRIWKYRNLILPQLTRYRVVEAVSRFWYQLQ